ISRLSNLRQPVNASADSVAERVASDRSIPSGMHAVVLLQQADGSWDLTPALARAIDQDLAELELALPRATGDGDQARRAWATALALARLDDHARNAYDEWRLLAAKARAWLTAVKAQPVDGPAWAEAGMKFLARVKN